MPAPQRFGRQCIVVAIDARREPPTARAGRSTPTAAARPTGLDAVAWARGGRRRGAGEILLTSMDRDGTRDGYDLPLLEAVAAAVDGSRHRLRRRGQPRSPGEALAPGRADAVLAASIFHFGEYRMADARAHLAARGIPMRRPVR